MEANSICNHTYVILDFVRFRIFIVLPVKGLKFAIWVKLAKKKTIDFVSLTVKEDNFEVVRTNRT